MNTFKLALRGLSRNRRRSAVTLLAIALGFAAISLFAGYTHNVYSGLERGSIHGGLLGHLTLSRRGMSREGKLDPERYMLTAPDVAKISALLKDEPQIRLVAPRLAMSGLVSNGRASTIFIAEGVSPEAMQVLQENLLTPEQEQSGLYEVLKKKLDPAHPESMLVSQGLAAMLHLGKGDTTALLTNTLTGQANAMDATVGALINTGNANLNDKFAFMSLELAQSLYDMPGGADRLTVLLRDVSQTDAMRAHLTDKLKAAGFDVEIKTWQELSDFYTQVHNLFDMIFGFIFSIVLTVVVMSVANSMGMTVVERTREIGTLRAIGLKQRGIIRLFTVESLLLSLIGCAAGLLLALAVRYGVNAAQFSYVPPNSDSPVLLLVDLDTHRIALTCLMMLTVGTIAAWLPARRAAKQKIIDALGHV
ncbi:MAG: FtsX-like permease family protein [Gallionella sp.]|nr:FtsX-like permease family protein [Gallionella sp.]MDD4947760.1 FtsX-like permease family protein [Gallionella sp.]MDD5612832.1 FtsX-like permease family protein [Gallionella sp.]